MSSVPLSVQQLTKRFEAGTVNEKLALDGLSLEVPAGQFVTVLGSNGSGKSTLFNAILGKIFPDSGKILLGEEDVTRQKDYRRALNIGCLYQNPLRGTAPSMTIEENLALAYTRKASRSFFAVNRRDNAYFRDLLAPSPVCCCCLRGHHAHEASGFVPYYRSPEERLRASPVVS